MTRQTGEGNSDHRGLTALVMLLRFHGLSVDPAQIRHQFGTEAIASCPGSLSAGSATSPMSLRSASE